MDALSVHRIGNKSALEGVDLSTSPISIDGMLSDLLKSYFMKAFKDKERYSFTHSTSLNLNAVYSYVSTIFDNVASFHKESINIAKFL